MFLFGRKKASETGHKKKAVAFVDFEHWYISLYKNFSMKPDIRAWHKELSEKYDLVNISFFGDFSNLSLRSEIPKIREITSNIIETQNVSSHHKKDFTDFIMLDHIYQSAFHTSIDTFIIFTGDGHFSSVVSYLTTKLRKTVEIYGVKNAISMSLKNTATVCHALPTDDEITAHLEISVLKALKKIYETSKSPRPTFVKTVEAIARDTDYDKERISKITESLMEKGYIYQTKKYFSGGKFIKVLALNNALIKSDNLSDKLT